MESQQIEVSRHNTRNKVNYPVHGKPIMIRTYNAVTSITLSARWRKYLAIMPALFALGCAHSTNVAMNQQPEQKTQTASIEGHNAATLQSDPLLEGLKKKDIANAKKLAKQRYQLSWKTIAQRSRFVRSRMIATLNKLNAPTSLQVVPIVESSYNPYAVSHSGAIGLWQLMPATARDLGVRSNKKFDGRRGIDASTVAAVGYLQQLHQRFNSWPLAFAAYNIGPNALARLLKKHTWKNSDGLDSIPIPIKNRAYVQHIIGMVALLQEHTFSFPEPVKTRKVALTAPIDINRLALISDMVENDIFRFNPFLNHSQYLKTRIN